VADKMTPKTWGVPNWASGGEVIDTRTVCVRMQDMRDEHVTDDGDDIPVSEWSDDARAEYAALDQIIRDVVDNVPGSGWDISANGDAITLVHPGYLRDYVREYYADTYGGDLHTVDRYGIVNKDPVRWDELMQREPFCWVNWADVARAWTDRCPEITYHGVDYVMDV
jgi:hypothetical protein